MLHRIPKGHGILRDGSKDSCSRESLFAWSFFFWDHLQDQPGNWKHRRKQMKRRKNELQLAFYISCSPRSPTEAGRGGEKQTWDAGFRCQKIKPSPWYGNWVTYCLNCFDSLLQHGAALFHFPRSPENGSADKGDGKLIFAQTIMFLLYTIVMNIFRLLSPPHLFHSAHLHFPIWWLWKIPLCTEKDRKFSLGGGGLLISLPF